MMQTFLPFSSFTQSAASLDRKRLGKQRVEAWQIYLALTDETYGWQNHPAVKMWRGYEYTLLVYGLCIIDEWVDRGYKDTMYDRFEAELTTAGDPDREPWWLGMPAFHEAHRAILYRKDPIHYRAFRGTFTPELNDYLWPGGFDARTNGAPEGGSSTSEER